MLLRYSRTALLAAGFFAYAQAFFHYSRRSEAPAIIPDQVKGKTKPVTRAMSAGSSSRCGSRYQPLLSGIQDSKLKNVEQVSGRWNSISPDGPHTGSHLPWEWVYTNKHSITSTERRVSEFREMLQICDRIFVRMGDWQEELDMIKDLIYSFDYPERSFLNTLHNRW